MSGGDSLIEIVIGCAGCQYDVGLDERGMWHAWERNEYTVCKKEGTWGIERRWADSIEGNRKEVGWKVVNWTRIVQEREK